MPKKTIYFPDFHYINCLVKFIYRLILKEENRYRKERQI